jgi:hypothetical protein
MSIKMTSKDPDIRGSFAALKRASQAARRLSIATGTPFYVMKNGKVVDLNLQKKSKTSRRPRASKKR